jgi:hypothetical protein
MQIRGVFRESRFERGYKSRKGEAMVIQDLAIEDIDISEFNTRKDLIDGQADSTLDDLARSVGKQGLLRPMTV